MGVMETFEHWEQFVKQTIKQLEADREKKAAGQAMEPPPHNPESPKFKQKGE